MEKWYRTEELAPGILAVIDVDGGWFRSNSVLVDMGDYTIVVDTQYNEPRARDLLGLARERGMPDRFIVVNTHHHGDHAWGNHVFPGPSIMSRGAARMADALRSVAPGIYKPFFPWLSFEGSRYTGPSIVVEGETILLRGDKRRARLRVYPPAHTVGDMVVELPEERILVAGDLVFNKVTPLALDGTITGWIRALGVIEERYKGWTIVPGHGPLAGPGTLRLLRAYFMHVMGSVRYLLEHGRPRDPLRLAEEASPGPLLGWREPERLVLNIARALMDIGGRPPGEPVENLPELAQKMLEYRSVLERQIREGTLPQPPEDAAP